jgi:hypothetical protein
MEMDKSDGLWAVDSENGKVINTGTLDACHDLGYAAIRDGLIGLQAERQLAALLFQRNEPQLQLSICDFGLVNVDVALRIDADSHGFVRLERLGLCRVRQIDLDDIGQQWRGDDEDNEQHQHYVYERRNIYFAHDVVVVITGGKRHLCEYLFLAFGDDGYRLAQRGKPFKSEPSTLRQTDEVRSEVVQIG